MTGRAYVAGPMRGCPYSNLPAFFDAEADLHARGFIVHNPGRWDIDGGFDPLLTCDEQGFDVAAAMRHDLGIIVTWASHVFVLPGWQQSTGARLEVAVAQACGVTVVDYKTGLPVLPSVETAVA